MDFSRKLFSSLAGSHGADSSRAIEDAAALSAESLAALRLNISNPKISTSTMKENMLRLIHGEMMGEDVQFGTIYALKLAQSGQTVAEKRAGYLACYLLLQEGNELNIMLVNTLQKDLTSSNYHHVVVALATLCNLTLLDVLPSMVGHVLAALSHTHESVRKRALIALKNFYTRQPDLIVPYLDQIKGSLYDPEPSVMSAALGLFATVVQDHAGQMKDMVPVLIKILQQVVDNKLPKGYSYHGMAAPWIQIRCLLIMARLGQDDLSASMAMTPVVMASFHKARHGVDAAFGVLFEVIRTLNSFHPAIILDLCQSKDVSRNPLLIIPRFATSSNQNLKYLGISMLCNVHPNAWSDAWWGEDLLSSVVQALESRDMAIQRRALDLLYRMLTLENSENIIERLLYAFYQDRELTQAADPQDKTESRVTFPSRQEKLLTQILDAAERFGLSEQWYLDMVFDLLDRGGLAVTMQTVEKVMAVIERGAKSPAFNTAHLRAVAVQKSITVLAQKDYRLSSIDHHHNRVRQPALAYFIFWVLGEYGDNTDEWSLASIQETLARYLLINHDPLIQAFILSALTKVALRSAPNPVPSSIVALVQERILELPSPSASFTQPIHPYNSSFANVDVQQRAHEFLMVADLVS